MNIYDFSRHHVAASADIVTAYTVRELTAAAHVFRVWSNQNGKWSARQGAIVSRGHDTRLSACLYMSAVLDGQSEVKA